jgi:hypothetical protein
MNETLNQTINQTASGLTNIILDKLADGMNFMWTIAKWVSDNAFYFLPESLKIYTTSAFVMLPFILVILLMYGLLKSISKLLGFTAKWVVPILLVIFFMIIIFAFLGISGIQSLPPPPPIE